MQVASKLSKTRFRSEDAPDSSDQVYLKSAWVVTSLRHPALRVLCCLFHLVLCFFLGVMSPLLTSLKSPADFPVYGDLVKTATTGFTWQKLIFQSVVSVALLLFLRLVAYPRLVQRQWNWETSYRHATQTFSRLSRASEANLKSNLSRTDSEGRRGVMAVQTFLSKLSGSAVVPAVRLHVWNVGSSHGSWTFMAASFPFLWAATIYVTRKIAHDSSLEEILFPEDQNEAWTSLRQLELQQILSTALLTLSCLKLLVTLDWVLQDREYNRILFGNWLSSVRRAYTELPVVRLLWCWLSLVGVGLGGVYFGAISMLQSEWMKWSLTDIDDGDIMKSWLSNSSWHALLCSLAIALDLLWVVQDWEFPRFTSPIGSHIFGLPFDQATLHIPLQIRLCLSSSWTGGFLVLALLLPLEISQFIQIAGYSPLEFAQRVNVLTFRVLPLNSTYSDVDGVDTFDNLDPATRIMLQTGTLSRYFPWSAWDRVPALVVLLLALATLLWLWKKERSQMCFAVYLGLSGANGEQVLRPTRLDKAVPSTTKHVLTTHQRLRTLYKLRARSDSFCIGLAGLSVLTVWMQFHVIWRSSAEYHRDLPLQSPGETFAMLLALITFILLHQVHYRYCVKMEIMVLWNQIPLDCRYSLWRSPRLLLLPFITELLLCGVFLPPLIHGRVHIDEERFTLPRATLDVVPGCPTPLTMTSSSRACELQYSYPLEIVNMVVLVRLYWFARVIRNQLLKQLVNGSSGTVDSPIVTGKDMPVDSLGWSFRVYFALQPSKVLLSLFVTLWMSTATTVSIFERPFPSRLDGEDHALWLALVTMTGVGYGDAYPITTGGRLAVVLGAVVGGLAFISLMTSEFLTSLKGTKREHAVLYAVDRMKWERAVRECGANLIHAAWKRHHFQSGAGDSKSQSERSVNRRLQKAAHQFKLCRKRKPMERTNTLQSRGFYSGEMESKISLAQMETAATLDSLEQQMDRMERSIQSLLKV